MNYKVCDSARGHIFGTLKEACSYAELIRRETGIIIAVISTDKAVTHFYKE